MPGTYVRAAATSAAALICSIGLNVSASAQKAPEGTETPEEIAKDAQRDLKDNRFYNRPGATRAEYDAAWQECRLIARGSKIINGNMAMYNPAMYNPSISPLAAGIGGGIGAAIGAAIAEGIQRRENRKRCLMIKGWRLVKLSPEQTATVTAMSEADKQSYFNRIIGAQTVQGTIETMDKFGPPQDSALTVAPTLAGPATLWIHKDPAKAILPPLEPGQGAIVMAFRRNTPVNANRHAMVQLFRYDRQKGDLFYQPRDWKKTGDKTSYVVNIESGDKKAPYELRVIPVTAGDYVLNGLTIGSKMPPSSSNCFGAPMMHVEAGQYAYLADASPFWGAQLSTGEKSVTLMFDRNFAVARDAMAKLRPDIAAKMVEAPIYNRATYACAAVLMNRYDWPGAPDVPTSAPVAAAATQAP